MWINTIFSKFIKHFTLSYAHGEGDTFSLCLKRKKICKHGQKRTCEHVKTNSGFFSISLITVTQLRAHFLMVSSYGHNQAEEGIENIQHDLIFVMLPYRLLHLQRLHIFYQKN